MAVSEEVAENLSALDAKTVDEGTVVELLRKRLISTSSRKSCAASVLELKKYS